MKYCNNCLMPETKPDLTFDQKGKCSACIAFDERKNYSESGIINRKSGELVHEITIGIKSDNLEKNISFYLCS